MNYSKSISKISTLLKLLLTIAALIRATPAVALTFKFVYIDNDEEDFATRGWLDKNSLFQKSFESVGPFFSSFINATAAEIVTHVFASRATAFASGTFQLGNNLGVSNRTGHFVIEPAALSKLKRTFTYNNEYENYINLNASLIEEYYGFDDPTSNDATKQYFLILLFHEIMHGLGVAGYRSTVASNSYGTLNTYASIFDELTVVGGDGKVLDARTGRPNPMFFDGPLSTQVRGEKIRVTNQPINNSASNFYHLGDCTSSPPPPHQGLDSVISFCNTKLVFEPSCIDLAILADIGYPMTRNFYSICKAPSAPIKAPSAPSAPLKTPTAPIKAPTAPIKTPTAPIKTPIKAPTAPIKTPTAPVKTPTAPIPI